MKHWLVALTVRDRAWSLQVYTEAESEAKAKDQVERRIEELKLLGRTLEFEVGEVVALEETA